MPKLEKFSNLSKQQDDILNKNFCFEQDLLLTISTQIQEFKQKTSLKQFSSPLLQNSTIALAYFQYKAPSFCITQQISSDFA